jgi:hypothetical protein
MAALIFMGWAAFVGISQPIATAQGTESPIIVVYTTEGDNAASVTLQSVTATITAFSCDAHPANGMHPCGPFRDGTAAAARLHGVVAACPYEHIGDTFVIDGFGAVLCRDTPRHPYLNGLIHLDLFMSYPAAVEWGIQTREVRRIE